MATRKPIVNVNGTNQQIPNIDTLSVGVGIDAAAAGALAIGATTATSVEVTPNLLVATTANPDSARLHVSGGGITHSSSQFNARPGAGNTYEWINRDGAGHTWYVNAAATQAMTLTSAGSLGIGTTLPAEKLEVSGGDARINGLTVGRGNGNDNSNTAIGEDALQSTTGTSTVAVGGSALQQFGAGFGNTAIGTSAGSAVLAGNNLTLVGFNAQPSAPAFSQNQITLGNSSVTQLRCAVNVITLISDQRDKADIQDLTLGLDFLKTVHPVQFKWDRRDWYDDGVSDGSKKQDAFELGFIAQELDDAQTKAGAEWLGLTLKDNPKRWEATPMRLFPVVVKAAQELAAKAAAAEARADAAEARLASSEARLAALEAAVSKLSEVR